MHCGYSPKVTEWLRSLTSLVRVCLPSAWVLRLFFLGELVLAVPDWFHLHLYVLIFVCVLWNGRGWRLEDSADQWVLRRRKIPRFVRVHYVCLFVCCKTRKTILRLLCWEGSKPPGSDHTRANRSTNQVRTNDSGTYHVLVNPWLTFV